MTSSQKQMLEDCGIVTCVKDLCGYDIPDPYGRDVSVYRATRDALSSACDYIVENYIKKFEEE